MATNFIHFDLTDNFNISYLKKIREYTDKRPILHNSHRGCMANYIGYIGLFYFNKWINGLSLQKNILDLGITNLKATVIDVINYDVLVEFNYGGKTYSFKIEIKTKDRTVVPISNYEISIPVNTFKFQIPQYYFTISLKRQKEAVDKFTDIYFLGYISRGGYEKNKYEVKAGLQSNGAKFFCDTWNIKIDSLTECSNFPIGLIV
jgi:hypothetical protein